jgi:transcriptional regulator with XRE-family HTH domain
MKEKILMLMEITGMPKSFIANEVGISQNMLYKWLNGTRNLSAESEKKLEVWYNGLKIKLNNLL